MRKLPSLVHAIGLSLFVGALACILGPALAAWLGQVPTSPAPKFNDYAGLQENHNKFLAKIERIQEAMSGCEAEFEMWRSAIGPVDKQVTEAAGMAITRSLVGDSFGLKALASASNRQQLVLNRLVARCDQMIGYYEQMVEYDSSYSVKVDLWKSRYDAWRKRQMECWDNRRRLGEKELAVKDTSVSFYNAEGKWIRVGTELPPSGPAPK